MSTASAIQPHASAQVSRFLVCEGAYFPIEGDAPTGVYWIDWFVVDATDGPHAVRIVGDYAVRGSRPPSNILDEAEARKAFTDVADVACVAAIVERRLRASPFFEASIAALFAQRDEEMLAKVRKLLIEEGSCSWRDLMGPYTYERDQVTLSRLIAQGKLEQDDGEENPRVSLMCPPTLPALPEDGEEDESATCDACGEGRNACSCDARGERTA